jgi:phosphoglycolate phosphatase
MCYVRSVRKYDAVLFDWHDTLLAFHRSIWDQDKFVAAKYFGIELADEDIAPHWGRPAWELLPAIFKTDMPLNSIMRLLRRHSDEFPRRLFPDTLPTMEGLYGNDIAMAVVTGGTRALTDPDICTTKFPLHLVECFQYSEDTPHVRHRSDPDVLVPTLDHLGRGGISRGRILGVGDHTNDWEACNGAGIDFVGVTTGLTTAEEFAVAGVNRVIASLSELPDIVRTP